MLRLRIWIWTLGLLCTQIFIICVLWNLFEHKAIYIQLLEAVLPGFHWLTLGSLILGLIESFLYGAYAATCIVILHNLFYRKEQHKEGRKRQEREEPHRKAA